MSITGGHMWYCRDHIDIVRRGGRQSIFNPDGWVPPKHGFKHFRDLAAGLKDEATREREAIQGEPPLPPRNP
jgi:hypothetical protein